MSASATLRRVRWPRATRPSAAVSSVSANTASRSGSARPCCARSACGRSSRTPPSPAPPAAAVELGVTEKHLSCLRRKSRARRRLACGRQYARIPRECTPKNGLKRPFLKLLCQHLDNLGKGPRLAPQDHFFRGSRTSWRGVRRSREGAWRGTRARPEWWRCAEHRCSPRRRWRRARLLRAEPPHLDLPGHRYDRGPVRHPLVQRSWPPCWRRRARSCCEPTTTSGIRLAIEPHGAHGRARWPPRPRNGRARRPGGSPRHWRLVRTWRGSMPVSFSVQVVLMHPWSDISSGAFGSRGASAGRSRAGRAGAPRRSRALGLARRDDGHVDLVRVDSAWITTSPGTDHRSAARRPSGGRKHLQVELE